MRFSSLLCLLPTFTALMLQAAEATSARREISLNGVWLFQTNNAPAERWKEVQVPSSFQSHEGTEFHGIGWYRRKVAVPPVPAGKRLLLHFQAAATEAEVWWNGERLGTHIGGWTPFRFDVTELVSKAQGGKEHEIRVKLDEKVGHNTQGFLPIIAPHFGGLWQGVSLLIVPDPFIDDLRLMAIGEPGSGQLRLEAPLSGKRVNPATRVSVRYRVRGEARWTATKANTRVTDDLLQVRADVAGARLWFPEAPTVYEVELSVGDANGDSVTTRAAFRSVETFGPQIRLNGRPIQVRGLLNWGYSPPMVEPNPGEETWREELNFARASGFNLMKFCLWIPPRRYLELADEIGMLTWMEYPTWHPNFTEKYLPALRQEFREFFLYDRNHPSIVLRSLTCETGPSAELKVIQSLYDSAHELIPGALVEDDSSWIGWNRVHDFYDDHPYGNNHTWVQTLQGFNEHILAHGLKPLVLGESIAADTWPDREAILTKVQTNRPWWSPGVLDDLPRWTERMRRIAGPEGLSDLRRESLHYGMLMRKYQVETFRREVPYGGYVISVIRDIPNASMGLLDYLGGSKWSAGEWGWQRDTICLLKTESDRRSYFSGEPLRASVLCSHFGPMPLRGAELRITIFENGKATKPLHMVEKKIDQEIGTVAALEELGFDCPRVVAPTRLTLAAQLKAGASEVTNAWSLWVVPHPKEESLRNVEFHSSVSDQVVKTLPLRPGATEPKSEKVTVAARFDDELVREIESGGRVLLLPDGEKHSFPLSAHWFLRGAPFIPHHPITQRVPRELLLELQHFDLASEVVPNLPHLDSFDPVLLLWDTHDQKSEVNTHGMIFETAVGRGRLLVSAAKHTGTSNAAGQYLLGVLVDHLRSGPAPRHALPTAVWDYLKQKLHAEQTNLVSCTWQFRPDPKNEGLAKDWQGRTLESPAEWKPIKIGAWWESQGYPAVDGWAWYRLEVPVPNEWTGREIFLSFEGVDDIYELYVNGRLAGKGGDLATRKDALQEKKSHNIAKLVSAGETAVIAVRVYDWYGAGGIFRPVTLGTVAFRPELDLVR